MTRLSQKLHSKRGASILLALMFFLICGFVGAVVLGSAVTNAEKLQGRKEDQQAYYAVSSAARLIRDALDGASCVGVEEQTIYQCVGGAAKDGVWTPALHSDLHPPLTLSLAPEREDSLAKLLRTAAEQVFQSKNRYTAPTPFLGWSRDFTITAENLPEVDVHMTMGEEYTCVFTLKTKEGGNYPMTLTCGAKAEPVEVTQNESCAHTLLWMDENGEEQQTDYTFAYQRDVLTTTITWSVGSLSKGGTAGA